MFYEQDIQGYLEEGLGTHGLKAAQFETYRIHVHQAWEALKNRHKQGKLPLLDLPQARDDLTPLYEIAQFYRHTYEDIVVLGTGGSSLGGQALVALSDVTHPFSSAKPRVHFFENIDPHTFSVFFKQANPETTGFVVISKSGTTAETICQFLLVLEYLQTKISKEKLAPHFTIITEPKSSPLRTLAEHYGLRILDHDPQIGGRFSVLSIVGLLPALFAGIDPVAVREGAQWVLTHIHDGFPQIGATTLAALGREHNLYTTVLMPYSDRLALFGRWFRQLWAESLGKNGQGFTPIFALGTVDQHSQLQLYLDGPKDKTFTVITTKPKQEGQKISPQDTELGDIKYLSGHTMADLLCAEQQATIETLIRRGCPTRVLHVPEVSPQALGALMMHFMIETMLVAEIMQVNAFDQPAVEEGKQLARMYLEQKAYVA